MPNQVLISGGGVAACCCACLLSKAGTAVFVDLAERAASPVLMLSEQTQRLLRDVFASDSLFEGAARISKRVVAWGPASEPVSLPHSGLVMSEAALLNKMKPKVEMQYGVPSQPDHWKVISLKSALPAVSQHAFGSRTAHTSLVELRDSASIESCFVESTESGWLFLLPFEAKHGSLISVGAEPEAQLSESRLVAEQISGSGVSTGSFPASPRIVKPLCGPGWIACGTAAIAFDPIAGEGAGNAVREGILASAIVRAAASSPENELLAHYSNRLLSGFLRHLQDCCRFYETGGTGSWWKEEVSQMRQGIEWAKRELAASQPSMFRLVDFELQGAH